VYGRPNQKDLWAGVQCKGKDVYTHKDLTEKEVKTEVEKAKSFKPRLSQFIIATTGPKDAKVEELARKITEEHLRNGLFSVSAWGWHDIVIRLADFPDLVEKYYPGLHVDVKGLKREIEALKMAHAPEFGQPEIEMAYSVFLNILEVESLVEEIAHKKGIDERTVRENLVSVIHERVKTIETKRIAVSSYYGDNWVLSTSDIDSVFRSISEILDHNTGFKGYERLPLEIGVGTVECKRAKLVGLVSCYRNWHTKYYGCRPESFIVLSESVYQALEPLDKKMCTEIKTEEVPHFFAADTDRVVQRGRIFAFLEKIGYPGSKVYGRIDEVYVPPVEYEDIKEMLQEKKIVFITGTREYGKTYTAVRILWEYYNKGYQVKWIKGGEEPERIAARQKLEDIEAVLKPHHVVYFEDPFGRRIYEGKEGLEREIGTIMESCKRLEDTYVIITSREEVFKEFDKRKLSRSDVREYEKSLTLKRPSYNYKKRKEILVKWAENEDCQWVTNADLLRLVLDAVKNEKVLPTPLSMRDFSKATVYIDEKDQLKEKIKEKSEETAMAFAGEIKTMTDDKVVFLLVLFVGRFTVDFVKTMYETLVEDLNVVSAWEFERVCNWFKNDKVNISGCVGFSHPSYAEALKYVLVDNGFATRINKDIFSVVLLKLSETGEAAGDVAWMIAYHFDDLSKDVQKVLFDLLEKDEIAWVVAWHIVHHFDDLSKDVQNLLVKLIERDTIAGDVAWTVAYNFDTLSKEVQKVLVDLVEKEISTGVVAEAVVENVDRLPDSTRDKLLVALSEKDGAAGIIAEAVAQNFDKLSSNTRNILLVTFAEKDEAAAYVADVVAQNFGTFSTRMKNTLMATLPNTTRNNLLVTLAEKDEAVEYVARFVMKTFDRLPRDVRNDLLLSLAEKDEAVAYMIHIVVKTFDTLPGGIRNDLLLRLPENARNDLLVTLSEKDETAETVARFVAKNIKKIPRDVRNDLLLTLSKKRGAVRHVAHIVVKTFDTLPDNVRNDLLFTLSKKREAAKYLTRAVIRNFRKFPRDVRNDLLLNLPDNVRNDMLMNLAERKKTAGAVAGFVVKAFDTLPDNVRNDLLVILSEKDEAAGIIAGSIVKHFDMLPDTIRNDLLVNLTEKDGAADIVAGFVTHNFNKFPRDVRNDLLFNLSEKDETAKDAVKIIRRNFNRLSNSVRNKRLLKLAEKDEIAQDVVQVVGKNFDRLPGTVRNKLLVILAEKDRAAGDVVEIIVKKFDKLPLTIRNDLLVTLSRKDEASEVAAKILAKNFYELPEYVRSFLSNLSKKG